MPKSSRARALRIAAGALTLSGAALVTAPVRAEAPKAPACSSDWPEYSHDPLHSAAACAAPASATSLSSSDALRLSPRWFTPTRSAVTAEPAVVGGTAYVGDAAGTFYAVDTATGAVRWTFTSTDRHSTGFGEFASSAAVSSVPGVAHPVVYVGGGGTLWALSSADGHPLWHQDVDPAEPTSAIEIESSPVVDLASTPPEVIVGSDDNSSSGIQVTGVQAFDARTGALLWKYEPERDAVVHELGDDHEGDGCGDVWSSPALDVRAGLVVFGTGNCVDEAAAIRHHDFARNSGIFALDAGTGRRVWAFFEPPNQYDTGQPSDAGSGDDDFGSSAVIAHDVVLPSGRHASLVVEASKSGYVYAVDEATGAKVWQDEPSQAGQLSPELVGAVGGTIGSPALGLAKGRPTLFMTSAVPLPLAGSGVDYGTNPPQVTPDPSLAQDPTRVTSLHAVDLATGAVVWQDAVAGPSYASVTYSNGALVAPSTTGFSVAVYDASSGLPLWAAPTAAASSGGPAVVGGDLYVGTGTSFGSAGPTELPPQASGIWSFWAYPPFLQSRAASAA